MEFRHLAKCGAQPPAKEVVQLLEESLANARAGKVRAILQVVVLDDDSSSYSAACKDVDLRAILAELECARMACVLRLMKGNDEDEEDELPPVG